MGKTILILGGCKSGKSSAALSMAKDYKNKTYLATCDPQDEEMKERVRRHIEERGKEWGLVEEPLEIQAVFHSCKADVLLLDCVTLWISNLLMEKRDPLTETDSLLASLRHFKGTAILVSNEVGQGIVPENALARRFRDAAGMINQKLAAFAGEVVFVTAGIPKYLKKM
ncbi:MAG: bifunctional adenosylcobinamide kinase/adenosylcobinamide-phosphate guanylyltransferase [Nitrospinae bacterium]|nr:bifunctional adenosylcobinamide kinase/adenosylcobinamide-phosphate guanylyltransferase [Nitrospinota bacterium]